MHEFFLVCPIGLEIFLIEELKTKWNLHFHDASLNYSIDKGGITIQCGLKNGLLLNHILKCPSKILLRLKSQKCRDLPKLYKIIKKYPWKDILAYPKVEFVCSAKSSRLIHTKRIEKACLDGINDYFHANRFKDSQLQVHHESPYQKIYIRIVDDLLTISLDTSGELLHKRGEGQFRGHAGIRENIASLLLWALFNKLPQKSYHLLDPMCGSGTFLKEAKNQFHLSKRLYNYEFLNEKIPKEKETLQDKENHWALSIEGHDIDSYIIDKLEIEDVIIKQEDLIKF